MQSEVVPLRVCGTEEGARRRLVLQGLRPGEQLVRLDLANLSVPVDSAVFEVHLCEFLLDF